MEKSRKQVQALDAAIEKVSNHLQLYMLVWVVTIIIMTSWSLLCPTVQAKIVFSGKLRKVCV